MLRYAWRDLVRNPRRTLASLVGVILGVGLFSSGLFFIDGSRATMTRRALAPLTLDMQRVLTSPLGRSLTLEEGLSPSGEAAEAPKSADGRPLRTDAETTVTLTVTNLGTDPAHGVVVSDEPPPPLSYVHGTTRLGDQALGDVNGQSPLAAGLARTGLNLGTVAPGSKVALTYRAVATRDLPDLAALRPRGTVSSREAVVPIPANAPAPPSPDELLHRIAGVAGVAAAHRLSFVDLPAGALPADGSPGAGPVRIFAFSPAYAAEYPSIRLTSGSFRGEGAVLSTEAARDFPAQPGAAVTLPLPGGAAPLTLPVSGVADLTRAKTLFSSRKARKLEDFLYVPHAVIVSPATFDRVVIPAFRTASAEPGSLIKSLPVVEIDVRVDRSRLRRDPGQALVQTEAIARSVAAAAPGQDILIDNISNVLEVARDDAAVAQRMFVFLGLPGALLAAFIAAYAGRILAATQRRELATLRVRGAHRSHLVRLLAYRTLAFAGSGSILGTTLGFASVTVVLGRGQLLAAPTRTLVTSGLVATAGGMLATAVALYLPGHRSMRREIDQERGELGLRAGPPRRRRRLGFLVLAATATGVAGWAGAFDTTAASVSAGRAVSMPSPLLVAPLVAWLGGTLLAVRAVLALAVRLPLPAPPRFGPPVWGTLIRSLKRRSWEVATGIAGVGLVVAFGVNLVMFATTYEAAKAADARFVVGSDLRVTPGVTDFPLDDPRFDRELEVPGVTAATPVVFKLENSVLIGRYNQDRKDLAAIDPAGFEQVAPLLDGLFSGTSAAAALGALRDDPHGLLVNTQTAEALSVKTGDQVKVLLARGTAHQTLESFHVVGRFTHLPGFPRGVDLVANLPFYRTATGEHTTDFFLARTADHGPAGRARAVTAIRSGPGRTLPITIDSADTALDQDQSSLTALNVHGLADLESLYTAMMGAACIGIFVFGLLLQRRREYVTLRAQGLPIARLGLLVLSEAALVALGGVTAGLLAGSGMAELFVHVLRPLFIIDPPLTFPARQLAVLAALPFGAALASATAATAILRSIKPTELLRET